MPVGDQTDFVSRLRALLPDGWFPSAAAQDEEEKAPVLVGFLTGFASVYSWIWSLLCDVNDQTRIQTSTGNTLELHASDYFGVGEFNRRAGETDDAYRQRIIASITPHRNTRDAITSAISSAIGIVPDIIEPTNATDCKGVGSITSPAIGGGFGYNAGVHYGHLSGGQFFMTVPSSSPTDEQTIFDTINRVKAEGVVAWVQVT